jgi:integral membrane protein
LRPTARLGRVRKLFVAYRVLALVVGVLLVALAVGMVLKYLTTEGTDVQVALIHGWIYIVYVVVAFVLARRADWSLGFLVVLLLAGLVPVMIFFVEHKVVTRLRAEHPELR